MSLYACMSEARIQAEARNALAGRCKTFRANAGQGWTGDVERLADGSLLIRNPRPLHALPEGFSDLFGWRPITVTPAMVGHKVAQFIGIEMKAPKGRVTPKQQAFVDAVNRDGGRAGIARSVEDALRLVEG